MKNIQNLISYKKRLYTFLSLEIPSSQTSHVLWKMIFGSLFRKIPLFFEKLV